MLKKVLALFTTIVAGLAVVGVAWAGGEDDGASVSAQGSTEVSTGATVETSSTGDTAATGATIASSSSSQADVDVSTPTTVDDDDGSTTSSSVPATTSTSTGTSSSTSFDDDDDDDDDRVSVTNGITTHVVPGVGTVTISAFNGTLTLVSVVTSWQIEEQRVEIDRIEIEFVSGDAEAEFEARAHDGRIEVRIETD